MNFPLNEAIEFNGQWWLPSREGGEPPRIWKPGVLTWKNRDATLELFSPLTETRGSVIALQERRYPAIHGISTRSEHVSILDGLSIPAGFNFGSAGLLERETVRSSWVAVGAHVDETTQYGELRVRVPGLDLWLGRANVTSDYAAEQTGKPATVVYKVALLPSEEMHIKAEPLTVSFEIGSSHKWGTGKIRVDTSAWLRIKSPTPNSLDWLLEQFGKVSTLLTLIAGAPMGPDCLIAKTWDGTDLQVLVSLSDDKTCDLDEPFHFFLTRPATGCDLCVLLNRWFDVNRDVGQISQLARGVLSSSDLWLHVEFATLMQALEGFHRATMDGLYLPEEEYEPYKKALISAIPGSAPTGLRDALRSRVRYGNEKSLRTRLRELANRIEPDVMSLLMGGKPEIPGAWVDTRNQYTHWDGDVGPAILQGIEMHRASVRMRLFLRVLYLHLLGISPEAMLKALNGANRESQYLLQLNAVLHHQNNPESQAGGFMSITVQDP
ncbi:conserved hypothetical protein [Thiomonas arsenitoxydans]|uniref:Uncharacterized protein n=1 Tax=Thiomonas arsenitoxydans (strain DSM 22701 / CIP 110005 / 3As) TaxID=426114 RepID=D6CQ56_THIA3|nr:HEPN domain-containing protein [Thiomonas arsenitoxydans]CAZ88136.1 hypothetical protein THI_1452 [Thiomonas arsenitoxydans]CQR32457.1 conserved hypothetical protein [Thiomonas arsenitoxydans]CQR32798.1 conserved hypothetical protein [Thiomonas arsenitoxydans]CQR34198.1 conserved hypothetical protein [Thiomonas arsenitoxydans]CQR40485.1 conserved hypothetical protein [Thiomonas arsenitoxydans]